MSDSVTEVELMQLTLPPLTATPVAARLPRLARLVEPGGASAAAQFVDDGRFARRALRGYGVDRGFGVLRFGGDGVGVPGSRLGVSVTLATGDEWTPLRTVAVGRGGAEASSASAA